MNHINFLKLIKADKVSGAYLFHGEEEYLKDKAVENVIEKYISRDLTDMNLVKLNGSECKNNDIENAVVSLPFMSQRRVVIVNDYPYFKLTAAQLMQETKNSKLEDLNRLIKKCPNETILIFIQREILNPSTIKLFKDNNKVVTFTAPKGISKEKIILQMAEKKKLKIKPFMVRELLDYTSSELLALDMELEKLKAYVLENEVTQKDIYDVCISSTEYDVFKMLNCISYKNGARAISIYRHLILSGQSPQAVISMIQRQFRALFYMDEIKSKDIKDYKKTAAKLRTKDFVIKKMEAISYNISDSRQKLIAEWCADADYLVKKGKITIENSAELLIMRLINI